jgi:hypothetical protein
MTVFFTGEELQQSLTVQADRAGEANENIDSRTGPKVYDFNE